MEIAVFTVITVQTPLLPLPVPVVLLPGSAGRLIEHALIAAAAAASSQAAAPAAKCSSGRSSAVVGAAAARATHSSIPGKRERERDTHRVRVLHCPLHVGRYFIY